MDASSRISYSAGSMQLRLLLVACLLVGSGSSAQSSFDVLKDKKGKVRVGKITRELDNGVLFLNSDGKEEVIPWSDIDDLQTTRGGASVTPPQPSVAPPPSTPTPAAPESQPAAPPAKPAPTPPEAAPAPPPQPPPPASDAPRAVELPTHTPERNELVASQASTRVEPPGLGGPISLTLAGAAVTVLGAILAAVFGQTNPGFCQDDIDLYCRHPKVSAGGQVAGYAIAGVGGAVLVGGSVWLIRNLAAR